MDNLVVKYISGVFKGNFKTEQNLPLVSGQPLPKGFEHLIKIYRGEISDVNNLEISDYENQAISLQFQGINNIQVQSSSTNSLVRTRIYAFKVIKFVDYKISNVHLVDGKTVGSLEGKISGELSSKAFSAEEIERFQKEYQQDNKPIEVFEDKDIEEPNLSEYQSEPNIDDPVIENDPLYIDPSPNPDSRQGCRNLGCFSWFSNWLRWLYYFLLIMLLLLFLYRCTEFGRLVKCKIELISMEKEMKRIKADQDSILRYIQLTKNQVVECGQNNFFEGETKIVEEFYNLGTKSGLVQIKYDTKGAPDRIEIIYDGKLVAETKNTKFENFNGSDFQNLTEKGFAQFSVGSPLEFDYKYDAKKPTYILVRVVPNQENSNTRWNYFVNCPK